MNSILTHILSSTDAKATGPEKWLAHCGAHGSKRHRDLSIREANDRILLHCFAGCSLENICTALGIRKADLFFDTDYDPRQIALHRRVRAQARAARAEEQHRMGLRLDATREAESLIVSARNVSITGWTDEQLHRALNRLADAYAITECEEAHGV